ncbi:MAG: ion transporter [Alphaproteobacteria bacterium]|nr:ion transporter [Alphaproteobacteria bacterium]
MLESTAGRVVEGLLVALIIGNVVAVALESIPPIYARFHAAFAAFEQFSLVAYTIEYVLRVWSSVEDPRIGARGPVRGRIVFALRPLMMVDFLAFAPSYLGIVFGIDLRVLRIFRLFRLLKLARYSQALQALLGVLLAERNALFASVLLLLSVMCLEGELMHLAEGNIQPQSLGTLPGAMYWALTTLTTVGYGDITPATPLGKVIAGTTMVTGLALFALPVGIIANGFVTGLSRRRFAVSWNMLRRQPLLRGLDIKVLNEIIETATAALVKEHAHLTVAGREAREFYLIVGGTARAESEGGEQELKPGEIVGAEALDYSASYRQTVTAVTEMRVLEIPGDELRRLLRKYPVLGERIARSAQLARSARADPAMRIRELEAENAQLRRLLVGRLLESLRGE